MKKDTHPLDDFFRESLKDLKVTPSGNARSRFLQEATMIGGKGGFRFWRWFNSIFVAVVITASVILYYHFLAPGNNPIKENDRVVANNSQKTTQTVSIQSVAKPLVSANKVNAPLPIPTIVNQNTQNIFKGNSSNLNTPTHKPARHPSPPAIQKDAVTPLTHQETPISEAVNTEIPKTLTTEPKTAERQGNVLANNAESVANANKIATSESAASISVPSALAETAQPNDNPYNSPGSVRGSAPKQKVVLPEKSAPSQWMFSPFAKYSFDWIYDNKVGKAINSLGVEGKLQYGRFFVTLGGDVLATSGNNRCQVLYNDYLGNYKKLDSITFAWDENHYHLIPQYYTSVNKVWDSAISTDYYQISKKYRLVRIPFMLGYDLIQKDRFQLALKTGVAMNFCLDKRQVSGEYAPGQNKLVGSTQENDSYAGNNYYLLADLVASYYLTRRLVLDLEPHFDYLINPSGSQPKGINNLSDPGIRISIKYKF